MKNKPIFYFFCGIFKNINKAYYEHYLIAIAEGLLKRGINLYGNINYWPTQKNKKGFLIEKIQWKTIKNDIDYIFISHNFINNFFHLLPNELFQNYKRKFKIIIIDGSFGKFPKTEEKYKKLYPSFIFRSHYTEILHKKTQFIPWQFGWTERMYDITKKYLSNFKKKENVMSCNYRVQHQSRSLALTHLYKNKFLNCDWDFNNYSAENVNKDDIHLNNITGGRHSLEYYFNLSKSRYSFAFGGHLEHKYLKDKFSSKIFRSILDKFFYKHYEYVWQHDSWRFWESLLSGCLTFHINLEVYGAQFPILPKSGMHYAGISFKENLDKQIKNFITNAEEISLNGREWVLKEYSPLKITERILNIIE